MVWLVLLLGLLLLGSCLLLPREIGREDESLITVRLRAPNLERVALRVSQRRARPRRTPPAPFQAAEPPAPEAPSAMGAPQPVLSEQPAGLMLPGQ